MDIGSWQIVIVIIIFFVVWFKLAKKSRTKEVEQYNKKHNKNFKTWEELDKYREDESKKIIEKEKKAKEEKKRREKLEKTSVSNEENFNDESLMSKVKRLKSLYKNGTLTKAEFEKAKNKLLK